MEGFINGNNIKLKIYYQIDKIEGRTMCVCKINDK
jgi:hypothetical protein